MNILEELEKLEKQNIFVCHEFIGLGSDEWGFTYRVTYLPKDKENEKRRVPHMIDKHSFQGAGSTYMGAWDTIEEALINGIKYAKERLL